MRTRCLDAATVGAITFRTHLNSQPADGTRSVVEPGTLANSRPGDPQSVLSSGADNRSERESEQYGE